MRILKYKFPGKRFSLVLPNSWHLVLAGQQADSYCIWIEQEDNEDAQLYENVDLYVAATGESVPKNYKHLYSFQAEPCVWHIFRSN